MTLLTPVPPIQPIRDTVQPNLSKKWIYLPAYQHKSLFSFVIWVAFRKLVYRILTPRRYRNMPEIRTCYNSHADTNEPLHLKMDLHTILYILSPTFHSIFYSLNHHSKCKIFFGSLNHLTINQNLHYSLNYLTINQNLHYSLTHLTINQNLHYSLNHRTINQNLLMLASPVAHR